VKVKGSFEDILHLVIRTPYLVLSIKFIITQKRYERYNRVLT